MGEEINVQPGSLDDFAAELRAEIEYSVRPETDRLSGQFSPGVRFGMALPSGYVQSARTYYHQAMTQAVLTMQSYIAAAEELVTKAGQIADNYRRADTGARARVETAPTQPGVITWVTHIPEASIPQTSRPEKSVPATMPPGWGADWTKYNLRSLWPMVEPEDDSQGWDQVNAWERMRQTAEGLRRRLEIGREALESTWSPDTSSAAAAFDQRLTELIQAVRGAESAAGQTTAALGHVMEVLKVAKTQIGRIYVEYEERFSDLTPRFWDHAEDKLNDLARQFMAKIETAVFDVATMIVPPQPYDPTEGITKPPKPPRPPEDVEGGGHNVTGGPAGSSPAAQLPELDPTQPNGVAPGGTAGGGGPALAGAPTTSAGSPGLGAPGGGISPVAPSVGGASGSSLPIAGPYGPGAIGGPGSPGAWVGRGTGGTGGLGAVPTAGGRGPGGVAGHAAVGGAGAVPMGVAGGAGSAQRADKQRTDGDRDNLWEAAEGVDPLIEPAEEDWHDPGPGLIIGTRP